MNALALVNTLLESVDPALAAAMQKASADIFANEGTQMYGGGRPDKRRAMDGYDINCGLCEEWAEDVRKFYEVATGRDEVEVLDPNQMGEDDDSEYAGHVFIKLGDKFYDVECSEGVVDWRQLPLFVNNQNKHEAEVAKADEPSQNFARFAKAIGDDNERHVLSRFKKAVRGYIKWVHTDDEQGKLYDDADLVALRKVQTFAEAEAILKKYEGEPSFLYMVRSGYFV